MANNEYEGTNALRIYIDYEDRIIKCEYTNLANLYKNRF